jgi:asparagine synthase (glutamine-hydrolysing)
LSEDIINAFGIFDAEKAQSLVSKIKNHKNLSEMDQMAIAAILSTQLLNKLFIKDIPFPDVKCLANLKILKE